MVVISFIVLINLISTVLKVVKATFDNMAPRLSGQPSSFISGSVFFVSKSLLGILKDKRNLKNVILS